MRALAKAVEGVEGGDETEAVEVLPYGDPLFRDEVGEMGLAEGRQGELSVTADDELLEVRNNRWKKFGLETEENC